MSKKLNTAEPPKERKMSRNSVIAVAVTGVVILVVVIGAIFFSLGKKSAGSADNPTPEVTQSESADPGTAPGGGDAPSEPDGPRELGPVSPELKEVVESQWRLDEADQLAVGNLDAKLVVQTYFDFRCGYCAQAAVELEPQLKPLVDDGTIRIEYHNLPVLGEESMLAAQASLAAANQGKFADFHHYVFQRHHEQNPVEFTEAGLADVAREIGVADIDKFTADMTSAEIVAKVQEDYVRGTQQLGITGTPAFIIGYSYVPGYIPFETFTQVVDAELARPAA
ncbi:DsbA family protein [Trueperella bialowiezensis]|uniref:Disulfide isomerase/thiol-disulfide oxidase n=1 Tax=Trueperella bialowiezensis TaxID=312285 RepID=A0A3S4VTD6_9ACTO|nr:thioredoxin domain-containing protein [Trueperella bialowiezensis]VEI13296.1 disulfide isomerase/thiol-disulfide oxidase [Trueperella bialowiezensis]